MFLGVLFLGGMLHCVIHHPLQILNGFLLGLLYSFSVTCLALADSPWVKKVLNLSFKGDDDLACDFPCSTSVFDLYPADGSGGGGGGGGGVC